MSWWSIITAVSTGAAAFIAIGYVSYTIYETYMREKQHSYRGSKKKNRSESRTFVEYENIKPRKEELRHRNISKNEIQNEKQSVTKKEVPDLDHSTQTDRPETLLNNENCILNRNISKNEVQNEKQSVTKKVVPVLDHSTQTDRPETVLNNGNCILNDDISSVTSFTTFDGTESTCDSIASIESITSAMDQDLLADSIPTWSEMSGADRNLSLCSSCEEGYVSTVTIPCEHPYLCEECAPILFQHYSKCPHCSKYISDYQSIENL